MTTLTVLAIAVVGVIVLVVADLLFASNPDLLDTERQGRSLYRPGGRRGGLRRHDRGRLSSGLEAVDAAVHAPPSRLDVGVINDERFAVMAGIGFDVLMIRDANPALKRRIGSAAYVLSVARNLRSKVFHADVAVDGRRQFRGRTAMVLIGNCGAVTGGLEVFPEARHDDGVLDIAVLRAHGVRQWLSVGWRLLTGRAQRPELVHRCQGTSVVVTTGRPVPCELDGEVRDPTRVLTVGVEPGALLVRCPVPPAR